MTSSFLWKFTPRNLSLFQSLVNTRHPTIKYTFNSSQDNIQFLDIEITQYNTQLETRVYSKLTDSHAYLLPTSCHPKHTFASIPYSQALRVIRNCSTDNTTTFHLNEPQTHFNNRGFNASIVSQQIQRAKQTPRNELLTYKPIKENRTHTPLFSHTPRFSRSSLKIYKNVHDTYKTPLKLSQFSRSHP